MIAQRWRQLADRVDAYSLRQRGFLFGALVLGVLAVLDAALLKPQSDRKRQHAAAIAQRQAELKTVQAQMHQLVAARAADPDRDAKRRLDELKGKIAAVEAAVAAEQKGLTTPEQMRRVLEELLGRHRRVELVELRTLPAASILEQPGSAPKPAAGKSAPAPAPEALIFRHGIEITVAAPYLDLLAYLAETERVPTQLYWGKLDLAVQEYPRALLKLTVYTLSLDRDWMRV